MQQGLLGRISRSVVLEYHAFGIISEGPKAEYHYMICGVQGMCFPLNREILKSYSAPVLRRLYKKSGGRCTQDSLDARAEGDDPASYSYTAC